MEQPPQWSPSHVSGREVFGNAGFSDSQHEFYLVLLSKSKLKSSIRTSTLMAGFALVAMVEIEIHGDVPYQLLIPFSVLTAMLIFIHLLSLMIATCLLPDLEVIAGDAHPQLLNSAFKTAKSFPVQFSWFLSNFLGIGLFLAELIFVGFVKFYPLPDNENIVYAAVAALVTIIILTVLSVPLAVYYFRVASKHKIRAHEQRLHQAQEIIDGINQLQQQAQPVIEAERESTYSNGQSSYYSGRTKSPVNSTV